MGTPGLDPFAIARAYMQQAEPSPQAQAEQRGYLAQVPVGLARGLGGAVASVPRALSAIPGVRTFTEPVAEAIEGTLPLPSGGVLESGIESGSRSLATAVGVGLATGGALSPLGIAGIVGGIYGTGELAETRKRLEGMNEALVTAGQTPLSTGEIYQIATTRGLIEGGGEALGSWLIVKRVLGGAAAQAVRGALAQRLPGVVGRAARETAFIAAEEVPVEMAQAAGQAGVERGVLGEPRTAALEQAGQPVSPRPSAAAGQVVGPSLVASALFGGVQAVAARRPMPASATATSNAGTPAPPPAAPTAGGTPQPLPFVRTAASTPEREGIVLGPEAEAQARQEGIQARFQRQAREAAAQGALPSPLASAPPAAPAPPATALVPYGALDRDTLAAQFPAVPSEVIEEALQQAPMELQRRLSQLDETLLQRGYGEATPEELQPLLERQAFYETLVSRQVSPRAAQARPLPFVRPPEQEGDGEGLAVAPVSPIMPPATPVEQGPQRGAQVQLVNQQGDLVSAAPVEGVEVPGAQAVAPLPGAPPPQAAPPPVVPTAAAPGEALAPEEAPRFGAEQLLAPEAPPAVPGAAAPEPELARPLDVQRQSGTFTLTRTSDVAPDAASPHGAYYSIASPGFVSPHAADYPAGRTATLTFTPQRLLDLGDTTVDAGNAAARQLLGTEQYDALRRLGGVTYPANALSRTARGTRTGKTTLARELTRRYPGVEWSRYADSYEMLMGVGGLEARKAGYDAILATDNTDPNLAEMVVLEQREAPPAVPGAAAPEPELGPTTAYKGFTIANLNNLAWKVMNAQGEEVLTASSEEGARLRIDQRYPSGEPTSTEGIAQTAMDARRRQIERGQQLVKDIEAAGYELSLSAAYVRLAMGIQKTYPSEDFATIANRLAQREAIPLDIARKATEAAWLLSGREPGQPPSGRLQVLQPNATAGQGPVTLPEVQRLFRGQQVTMLPDGTLRVAMPVQGYTLDVVNVHHITPTEAELELSIGQPTLGPTQTVLGRATPLGQGMFRIEVTPGRTAQTLYHEGEHFFEDAGLLNERDIATLNRTLARNNQEPTAENRADLLAARLNANTKDLVASPLMRVVRKVQQFLDRLARLLGFRTTGQIVRRVQSGAIFEREGMAGVAGAGQLELPAGPARLAPQSVVTTPTGDLKPVYHGTARMFDFFAPEQRRGRLQVVTEPEQPVIPGLANAVQQPSRVAPVAPNATPRTSPAGIRTEAVPVDHYQFVADMLTPAERAQFQALEAQGVATFRKERIPDKQMFSAGERQKDDWEQHPATLQKVMEEMHQGTRAATEAQLVALSLMADEELKMGKVLHDQGIMSDARFRQAQEAWTGPHGALSYARMALSTFGRGTRLGRYIGPYLGGAHLYENAMHDLEQTLNAIPPDQRDAFGQKLLDAFNAGDYATLRDLSDQIPNSTLRERFFEFYYGSILSGIGTLATNEYSTASYQLFHNALVRPIAGLIDKAVSGVTGRDRQIYASETLPALAAQFKGMPASLKAAWWVFRGDPRAEQIPEMFRRETLTSLELGTTMGAWDRATYNHDWPLLGAKAGEPIQLMRKAAPFITAASRLMGALDVGLSINAFDQEVAARATRAALQQNIPPDQREAFEANFRQHFLTREGQDTIDEVYEHVKQQVFRGSMGVLGRTLTNLRNVPVLGPFFQLLLPFARTPDQLLQRGMELLPGVPLVPWAYKNMKWSGWMPYVGKEALDNDAMFMLAKQVVGTFMAMGLAALWQQGDITGGPPEDPGERDAWQRQGKVPYSAKVGDTWYSWRKFEPMSLPLGIITTVFDTLQRRQERLERRDEVPVGWMHDNLAIAAVGVQAAIAYVMDASYFSGIANFFEGVQGQRSGTGDIPKGVMRQVSSMMTPWVGLQRSLIAGLDASGLVPGTTAGQATVRQPQSLSESITGSLFPFALLEGVGPKPRINVFGEPVTRRTSTLGELLPIVPPVQRGVSMSSELEDTLNRLRYYPSQPAKIDTATGKSIPSEIYRRLQELRGPLVEQALEQAVSRAHFDRLDPQAARKVLQNVVAQATKKAKAQAMREAQ